MSKETVLRQIMRIWDDPRYEKDGTYMYHIMLKRLKKLINSDRDGVIDAMRYWLSLDDYGKKRAAEDVVGDLLLKELRPQLVQIKKNILKGEHYDLPIEHYLYPVEQALKALDENDKSIK